ncbi:MAG: 3-dehydroquinate synthase [Actinomycetota bacterium]|nr:3-dehydroquinate synthase [Actinomycetota bacterium]
MKKIIAKTSNRKYPIYLGNGIFKHTPRLINRIKDAEKILLVSNDKIDSIYHEPVVEMLESLGLKYSIHLIDDGEKYKNIASCQQIYNQLLEQNFHRNDILIAFGGGVIGDLAGFAAATYHRGLKLIQYPSTIISQVDSSIGGKVAVNYQKVKDIIGTFYQPHMVIMDSLLLSTLEREEILNGLGEVIKYGIVFDRKILQSLDNIITGPDSLKKAVESNRFMEIIYRCAKIKAQVVAVDEYDTGYRNLLNFGHTVGHALEKASGLTLINHGKAVSLGMLAALDISISLGYMGTEVKKQIVDLYNKIGLPLKIEGLDIETIMEAVGYDKKFTGKKNKFILLKGINKPFLLRAKRRYNYKQH